MRFLEGEDLEYRYEWTLWWSAMEVRSWAAQAGLPIGERLAGFASSRLDLAHLTDEDWQQILAPLPLKLGKLRRVEAAIRDLRVQHNVRAPAPEAQELQDLQRMFANGTTPQHKQHRRDRSPDSVMAPSDFIQSPSFVGGRPGFVFKNGPHGVGYYPDVRGSPIREPASSQRQLQWDGPDAAAQRQAMDQIQRQERLQYEQAHRMQQELARRYAQEHEAIAQSQRHQQALQTPQRTRTPVQELSPRSHARAEAHKRLMERPF